MNIKITKMGKIPENYRIFANQIKTKTVRNIVKKGRMLFYFFVELYLCPIAIRDIVKKSAGGQGDTRTKRKRERESIHSIAK